MQNSIKKDTFDSEKNHSVVLEIIHAVDPTTMISAPTTRTLISTHLIALLETNASGLDLAPSQLLLFKKAMSRLKTGIEDEEDYDMRSENDED